VALAGIFYAICLAQVGRNRRSAKEVRREVSASKHTPGPWGVPHFAEPEAGCDCRYVLCDSHMGAICTITWNKEGDHPPLEQAQANARLIAAAPELLDACKELRAACAACFRVIGAAGLVDQIEAELDTAGVTEGFGSRAGAAIAKAEG